MEKYLPKIIGTLINTLGVLFPNYAAKLAMHLFSVPRKGRLKDTEIQFLKSTIQKDFKHKGFIIKTYQLVGSQKTILLAHGWESNSYRWISLIAHLQSKNYNIIALDAPGHGASGNKEFNAILYSECIHLVANHFKPETIIGHSVGGMATIFAMHTFKINNVKRLILLGAPDAFQNILMQYESTLGYTNRIKKAIRTHITKKYNHPAQHFSTSNFCTNIVANTLIIHDKKDRIIPFNDALKIKRKLKNVTLIETKGYGHGLKSKEVYNHILNFLNT